MKGSLAFQVDSVLQHLQEYNQTIANTIASISKRTNKLNQGKKQASLSVIYEHPHEQTQPSRKQPSLNKSLNHHSQNKNTYKHLQAKTLYLQSQTKYMHRCNSCKIIASEQPKIKKEQTSTSIKKREKTVSNKSKKVAKRDENELVTSVSKTKINHKCKDNALVNNGMKEKEKVMRYGLQVQKNGNGAKHNYTNKYMRILNERRINNMSNII